MKLTIREALRRAPGRVVVESVDLSLYIASIEFEGERVLLIGEDGKPLKTRNLLAMKELLAPLAAWPSVLRQRSAYDEMCGQSWAPADNTLEVPLDVGGQPAPHWEH
ncbi:DUF6482 family protein [Pseudohaliea sp.]|uniref:DUF6482 family protein n=1 Tax=Pseudohaliea sp. TaxID=2740289 RepID=UPI0032EDA943